MPSFDIVSDVHKPDLKHAVENAQRALEKRWDFKDADASFSLEEKPYQVTLTAREVFQLQQMVEVLRSQLAQRNIDPRSLDYSASHKASGKEVKQVLAVRTGLTTEMGKGLVKQVKAAFPKIQTQIQGEKVRVTDKSRDGLQAVMRLLKAAEFDRPLQFENFKD